jgi:hypothetical protein
MPSVAIIRPREAICSSLDPELTYRFVIDPEIRPRGGDRDVGIRIGIRVVAAPWLSRLQGLLLRGDAGCR